MRKLHRPVAEGVESALRDIFQGGFPADKVIQRHLKTHKKWGSQDRRLFAEAVYEMVRWWRRLLFCLQGGGDAFPDLKKVIGLWAQLHDVDGGGPQLLDEVEAYRSRDWPRAVRESIPDWIDEVCASELGEKWDEVLPTLNLVAPVFLRANTLRGKPSDLVARLAGENIKAEWLGDETLRLVERKNVFLSKAFQAGLFEVQDLNSQAVARALDPKPGERVIDACAGAGGKSLHLAALMANKGKILSLDVHEKKLSELKTRAARAGASLIETRLIDSTKVIKRLEESADRVLLDVPCSGMGVLRRNPDSKWRLKPEDVKRVQGLQKEILSSYSRMCKPGGRLVYSTCSILRSENDGAVESFLKEAGSKFRLLRSETLWPKGDGGDGFFIAVLEKADSK